MTRILLLTGPAGVGKSTLSWEVSALLSAADLPHATVETDELDRIFPLPTSDQLDRLRPSMTDISEANLAGIWQNYAALGCEHLIMTGVMTSLDDARSWIIRAIPAATFTVVRLRAENDTLLDRLRQRETSSGLESQIERTMQQAEQMSREQQPDIIELVTDGKAPQVLAEEVLARIEWV